MSEQNKIQLFENQPIRTAWNEEQEEWYFCCRCNPCTDWKREPSQILE